MHTPFFLVYIPTIRQIKQHVNIKLSVFIKRLIFLYLVLIFSDEWYKIELNYVVKRLKIELLGKGDQKMRPIRFLRTMMVLSTLLLSIFTLGACQNRPKEEDPIPEDKSLNLVSDGQKWRDVSYVYAQDNGSNPLILVEYDKGAVTNPALSKSIGQSTASYRKLALSIRGEYFIELKIISLNAPNSSVETQESFKIKLTQDYQYYEVDFEDDAYDIHHENIIRIEFIITPGANNHFGTFSVNQLELSSKAMTVDTLKTDKTAAVLNSYDGTSAEFDINQNWFDLGYAYAMTYGTTVKVDYAILPATQAALRSKVSGILSSFDYINFKVKGLANTNITFTLETSSKLPTEVIPTFELQLDGTIQDATIYLDGLSVETRNAITQVVIYINRQSLVPVTGQFEIHNANFSNTPYALRPNETVNTYTGDGNTFSFNQYWVAQNSLIATIDEDGNQTSITYTKQFATSNIYTELSGKFSDFDYINIRVQAKPFEEFLFQFDTRWSYRLDHHLIADEDGLIELSMAFALQFFKADIDAITGFRITPNVNMSQVSSSFTIEVTEFSKAALVTYDVSSVIAINDWRQVGNTFTIDSQENEISWLAKEGIHTVYARIFGPFVVQNNFVYRYIDFEARVDVDTAIEFEVDLARYEITLTPNQIKYRIVIASPTSGTADLWKFSQGFNFMLHMDTTSAGSIELSSLVFNNETEVVTDVIDINQSMTPFNKMTGSAIKTENGIEVNYTKVQFNSLMYYQITSAMKDGKIASDYRYINIEIASANTTEFLIELSGYANMTHYVTLSSGSLQLTLVLDQLMLPNQINGLQYINITPMPNSATASGTFVVSVAEFSNEALVNYIPETTISIDVFKEIGSTFTINKDTDTLSWQAGTGYKSIQYRMNGSYATTEGMSYQYLRFEAVVTQATTIELNIVGAKYIVNLTPGVTSYEIDLTTPSVGTADLWKFISGFNLLMSIDTSTAGSIEFGDLMLTNQT